MPKLKAAQLNTVSPEAAAILKTFKFIDIPNFIPITNRMIIKMRDQF
ncbi:hypothetical protein [Levilactobacillus bambusae]|nr:hypothetical protein [Levilactobacillus bambusae]